MEIKITHFSKVFFAFFQLQADSSCCVPSECHTMESSVLMGGKSVFISAGFFFSEEADDEVAVSASSAEVCRFGRALFFGFFDSAPVGPSSSSRAAMSRHAAT